MQLTTLIVTGEAQGLQPAVNPQDFTRLQEVQEMFSGTAPMNATWPWQSIYNFNSGVLTVLSQNGYQPTPSFTLQVNGGLLEGPDGIYVNSGIVSFVGHQHVYTDIVNFASGVLAVLAANGYTPNTSVTLQVNGGLLEGPSGLYVNSGIVSFVGHKHQSSDIVDFASAVLTQIGNDVLDSPSVQWAVTASGVQPSLILDPVGGLMIDASGLSANFGSGVNQISRGNHTHSQLHNPLTLGSSSSLALTLSNQVLAGEVVLDPLGGLQIGPSGIRCIFGTGANQVMPGNEFQETSPGLTVFSTNTLSLFYNASANTLSGVVPLDPAPAGGLLQAGVNGLSVVLGTTASTAAAGNHTHAVVNSGVAGFMSPAMYTQLQNLWSGGYLSVNGGTMNGAIFMNDDSIYLASGEGIFVNGVKVVGNRQTAPSLLVDDVSGTVSSLLGPIPALQASDSGVGLLLSDFNTNVLPAVREVLSSLIAKQNAMITALKNFGCIG